MRERAIRDFAGIGVDPSGGGRVLISDSGRVMTAAHVVNGMDEIPVGGIPGGVVGEKIIWANGGAVSPSCA